MSGRTRPSGSSGWRAPQRYGRTRWWSAGVATDWLEARLAEPQPAGVSRVLTQSVVWRYLGPERRARIAAAMEAVGERATAERPLGWVMMEPNRDLHRQEVRVRDWPNGGPMRLVALAHAHGAWIEGSSPPYPTTPYAMGGTGPGGPGPTRPPQ